MNLFKYIAFLFLIISAFWSCTNPSPNPKIIMKTELGNITVELFQKKAPITVSNFLRYIEGDRMEDATFYRTVRMDNQPNNDIKIEVIQGGLFEDVHPMYLPPIYHETTKETGVLHKDGVISMARMGPGTATCEFFICVGAQPSLDFGGGRNPDSQGFAAFGKVIDGMDVVHRIQQSEAGGQWLNPRIKIYSIDIVD